jgi:hypothetical protein
MLKRIFACGLFCLLFPLVSGYAQQSAQAGLVVRSDPSGAEAVLTGDAVVTGVTPTFFQYPLVGEYRLQVRKHGYESYSTRLMLDPSRQMEVSVELSPKTRLKAAARSLLLPGWGQRYTDQKAKGFVFHLLAVGSVAAYFIADHDFDQKYDRHLEYVAAFDSVQAAGGSYTELSRLHRELVASQQEAYDAEDVRRITIGAAIGIWTLSLLDVLFFFPSREETLTVGGLSIEPTADPSGVGLRVSTGF